VNQSQENWPDAQLSLSTATPSLGGAPPKLTTLKIDYYQPRYSHDRSDALEEAEDFCLRAKSGFLSSASRQSKKSRGFSSFRARSSLNSKQIVEENGLDTQNAVNVLSTTTEASMSSTSFAIPRRSTIDADVSFLFFSDSFYLQILISHRANHIK
jgi:hypothetical protein